MTTERTYFESDALAMTAEVLACTPEEDGSYRVVLSRTLFHPQGGGQPSDIGAVGQASMLKAISQGDEVIHITDAPVEGIVDIAVDGTTRSLHTRYHSAGHLVSVAVERVGWLAMKGDHRPGEARVVFERTSDIPAPIASDIEEAVAKQVAAALPRVQRNDNGSRTVTWGDLPAYACGGTHVASTDQIGSVSIVRIKEKKGQLSVHYEIER
jgi:Ser-tRNA(Ala) deacylase AlaX